MFQVTGLQKVTVAVDEQQIAWAIMAKAIELLGLEEDFDDAGCDWYTDGEKKICIANLEWVITEQNHLAVCLVDAANIMNYGRVFRTQELELDEVVELQRGVIKDCGG